MARPDAQPLRRCGRLALLAGLLYLLGASPFVTAKSLNQIFTPDLQPEGMLSISPLLEDSRIGNSQEVQFDLGLTHWAEVALYQGLNPREEIGNLQLCFLNRGPHLLTAGAVNWSSQGGGAQPLLEYGYYPGKNQFMVGVIHAAGRNEALLGYTRQLTDRLQLAFDYQSGPGNSITAGFTYNLTPSLQINPAVYLTNTHPHRALGYLILNWNLTLWRP